MTQPIVTTVMVSTLDRITSQRSRLAIPLKGLAFALVIGLALTVQAWAITQWTSNFDSDEAMWGLMARHAFQGQIPTYGYGVGYYGSAETLISAVFFQILGPSVPALRITSLLLFAVFLVLHALLVSRLWGTRTALISLLILAIPGWMILWWTYRPMAPTGIMFITGTAALFLGTLRISRRGLQLGRLAVLGVLIGVGVWSHQYTVVYFATLAIVWALHSDEWKTLHQRLDTWSRRIVRLPARVILTLVPAATFLFGVLSLFVSACTPATTWETLQNISRLILVGILASLIVGFFVVSRRRTRLIANTAGLATGFMVGNFPQWRAWLAFGVPPTVAAKSSCITGIPTRVHLILNQLLPETWAIPSLSSIFQQWSFPQMILWLMILFIILASLGVFAWSYRKSIFALLSLSPLLKNDVAPVALGLVFLLPIALDTFGSNTVDRYSARFLLITWQAGAVILALLVSRVIASLKVKALSLVLVGMWLFMGNYNLQTENSRWSANAGLFAPPATATLNRFLHDRQIEYGYADFWVAYPLDFLTQEQLTIAPYNGADQVPAYSAAVQARHSQAYIFTLDRIPDEKHTLDDLIQAVNGETPVGPVFPAVAERLLRQKLLDRQRVANWDVWLVTDQ